MNEINLIETLIALIGIGFGIGYGFYLGVELAGEIQSSLNKLFKLIVIKLMRFYTKLRGSRNAD